MSKDKSGIEKPLKYDDKVSEDFDITSQTEEYKELKQEQAKPILAKFEKARVATGDRSTDLAENMAFFEGKQYELDKYKNKRPWAVRMKTPYAKSAIEIRVASLVASDYVGELFPVDQKDTADVESLSHILKNEWERENMDAKVKQAIKTSSVVREGYVHIISQSVEPSVYPDKRTTTLKAISIDNPSSILIDPSALSMKSARYILIPSRMSYAEVLKTYPKLKGVVRPNQGSFTPDQRGENYLSNKDYSVEQSDVCTIITYYEKYKGHIRKAIVVEDVLAEELELTGLTNFPIAQLRWGKESTSPYGISLMDDLLELQKAINAIESSLTNTAVAYSSPSYAIKKGSGINAKAFAKFIGAPGYSVVVDGDPRSTFAPLGVPELSPAVAGVKNEYIEAINQIAGITSPFLGSTGTAGNTAQGARITMERARIVEGDVLTNIAEFVEDLTSIMVEYIISQYGGKKLSSSRIERGGIQTFDEVTVPEKTLKYTFYINLDSKTSYSREREKEKLLELYQMNEQYDADIKSITMKDIIKAYDMENMDELVSNYEMLEEDALRAKLQLIEQIRTNGEEFGLDPALIEGACIEILQGLSEEKMVAFPQLQQQIAEQAQQAQVMEQQVQQLEAQADDAIAQGADPTEVNDSLMQMVQEIMGSQAPQEGQMPPEMMQ